MHLTCTKTQALFPGEGVKLSSDKPLSLLWDCHHGNTFVLMVAGLNMEPWSGENAVEPATLEVSLAPFPEVLGKIEHFAAHHNLAIALLSPLPEALEEPLTLAAGHLPEAKLFVFCEQAVLTARATSEGNVRLSVAGNFKSRKLPCQETDIVLHLERPSATRLLSYCYSLVRGRI
ncbi:MAG: hypothetical protein WAU47_10675 [Desulfobaccales bacterium]